MTSSLWRSTSLRLPDLFYHRSPLAGGLRNFLFAMTLYLDYESGLVYHDAQRSRRVEEIALKYGDSLSVCLYVLNSAGVPMDVGTDTIRFGAALNGVQALFIAGFAYAPIGAGSTLTPCYSAVLSVATVPLHAALGNRASVHLEGEFERETYEGRRITSQTMTVHVSADIISTANPPAADPKVDYATEEYLRNTIAGVTAGNLPGFDLGVVKMEPANATPVGSLVYDEETHKYTLDLHIPVTPGADGKPGATPTLEAGTITTTNPGTSAVFRMRSLGNNHYAVDISLPLNKGDKGDKGDNAIPPTITVGTVTEGDAPAATLVANGVNAYKLNLVFVRGARGEKGDTGIAPPIRMGSVTRGEDASAEMVYDDYNGYTINMVLPRGAQGIQGIQGIQGLTGVVPPIKMGYVYSGETARAEMIFTEGVGYTLNLTLPYGPPGPTGSAPRLMKGNVYVLTTGSTPYFDVRKGLGAGEYFIDMGLPRSGDDIGGGTGEPSEAYILNAVPENSSEIVELTCRTDESGFMHANGDRQKVPQNTHTHPVNKSGYVCRSIDDQRNPSLSFPNGITMGREEPGMVYPGNGQDPYPATGALWFYEGTGLMTPWTIYCAGDYHTHIVDGPDGKSYVTTGPSGEIWWGFSNICLAAHQHALLIP